jgi:hypothetical protein
MICVYIDVQNVHMRVVDNGWTIDWERFFVYLKRQSRKLLTKATGGDVWDLQRIRHIIEYKQKGPS